MRYLLKDVDHFAGFAHAINTYVAGIALADLHGLGLIYLPLRVAHGMGHAWDDFFAADPRGLIPPLVAPALSFHNTSGLQIDGSAIKLVQILNNSPKEDASKRVNAILSAIQPQTLVWLRKGRSTFLRCSDGCDILAEITYAGLWVRERFWQAVHATSMAAASSTANVTIAVHVRRGDVTWLDRYGQPSHRWIETTTVVELLLLVRDVIALPLEPPAVHVALHSERGWLANDTAAVREVAPAVVVHLDSSPAATIRAMVEMASADILLLGSSGFSTWAGLFSCGIKLGAADTGVARRANLTLPMRHIFIPTSLTARESGPVAHTRAAAAFRRSWRAYARCKSRPDCRPNLCAPRHLDDARWRHSQLARAAITNEAEAQWRGPPVVPGAARREPVHSISADRPPPAARHESAAMAELWSRCAQSASSSSSTHTSGSSTPRSRGGSGAAPDGTNGLEAKPSKLPKSRSLSPSCLRHMWEKNLSAFLAARKHVPRHPAA